MDLQNNQRSLRENTETSTSCSKYLIFISCYTDFIPFSYKILNLHNFIEVYILNPSFQYRLRVGSDSDLIQAVHDVFATLDPNAKLVGQFGNEVMITTQRVLFYTFNSISFKHFCVVILHLYSNWHVKDLAMTSNHICG